MRVAVVMAGVVVGVRRLVDHNSLGYGHRRRFTAGVPSGNYAARLYSHHRPESPVRKDLMIEHVRNLGPFVRQLILDVEAVCESKRQN